MKNINKKGFTIVELVIVIAVIAILAAVLIPTFSGIVERANRSSAEQAAQNAFKALYTNTMAEPNRDFPDGLVFTYGDYAYTFFDREMIELEKVGTEKMFNDNTGVQYTGHPYGTEEGKVQSTDIAALAGCYSSSSSSLVQDAIYCMPKDTYTVYTAKVGSDEFYFFTAENLLLDGYSMEDDLQCYANVFCKKADFNLEADSFESQLFLIMCKSEMIVDFSNPTVVTAETAKYVATKQDAAEHPIFEEGNSVSAKDFIKYIKDHPLSRAEITNYFIYFSQDNT